MSQRRVRELGKELIECALDGDDDGIREVLERARTEKVFHALYAGIGEANRAAIKFHIQCEDL